ncbi:autotransporter-associated beta strand repeat-containing protein [Bosea caraganae]|uniref:autotransporter-associated beta strand repeat-containing protein n=1 Tax=Bosea caraganae TaxID=2763117 RepID=UPI0015F11AB2|nr:autotransporter-associated beta strand repeat-containing protein [Bosea caraganae]
MNTVAGGGLLIEAGATFTGAGQLIKTGGGRLVIAGTASHTGGTTVNDGTLEVTGMGSIPATGAVALSGAGAVFDISDAILGQTIGALSGVAGSTVSLGARTLTFGDATDQTLGGVVDGTGGLVKQGTGTQTLTGANTYTGGTTIAAGTLALGFGGSLAATGAVSLGSGTVFDISASGANQTIGALSGLTGTSISLGARTLTFGNATNQSFAGSISGAGGLVKEGTGTFTLSRVNSYTGGTTVNAGTLALNGSGALAANGAVNLAGAAAGLDISGASVGGSRTIGGLSGVAGSTVSLGARTLFFGDATNQSFGGVITGTGNLFKQGTGTQTLTGANTYTGGTTITAGTLALGAGGSLAATGSLSLSIAGAAFDISASGANQTIGALTGAAGTSISLGANTLTFGTAAHGSYAGTISGTGGLVKQGTGRFTPQGANTYTGGTTVDAGTLALGAGVSLAGTGAFSLADVGASLDISLPNSNQSIDALAGVTGSSVLLGANTLTVGNHASTTVASTISGTGRLAKQGTGTLRLTGANTYSGGTTLSAGTLALGNNGAIGTGSLTVSGNATLSNANGASTALANNIAINAGQALTLTSGAGGAGSLTLDGVISGDGSVTISHPGGSFVELSGVNSYTGGTTISAGTLALSGSGALAASGAVNLAGADTTLDISGASGNQTIGALSGVAGSSVSLGAHMLTFGAATGQAFGGVISGTGSLQKFGIGTQTLTGANTYTGGTRIGAGTLALGVGGSLAATGFVSLSVGTAFDISASGANQTIGVLTGAGGSISLGANTLTLGTATDGTFSGVIRGTGGLVKQGTGTFTLNGANTYTGGTTVNAGTLALGAGGSIAAGTGAVSLAGVGASLDISAGGNKNIGALSGVAGSSVSLGINRLTVGDGSSTTVASTIGGSGGRLAKEGTGTLTLTGANTYTGGTTLSAGTLALGNNAAIGTGRLAVTGSATLSNANGGSAALANTIAINAGQALTLTSGAGGAGSLTLNGVISGDGSVTISHPGASFVELSGANSYTGGTTFAGGDVAVHSDTALGLGRVSVNTLTTLFADSSSLSIANDVTLNAGLALVNGTDVTLSGALSGAGGFIKGDAGVLTLTGASSYTGGTAVDGGTLRVEGSLGTTAVTVAAGATLSGSGSIDGAVTIANGGTLAPGSSPGTLTVGSLLLNASSQLAYELGTPGVVGGGVNDLIVVDGNLTLDGLLNITPQSGFGTGTYRLFNQGSLVDHGLALGIVPAGYSFSVDATTAGQVNLVATYDALQFWNGSQSSANGTVHGGGGIWDGTATNWTDASGSIGTAWSDMIAVFAGPAGGTVTIASDRQVQGLQFGAGGYVLNGPGALQIAASATELRIDTGLRATINASIQGGGGLEKTGGGTIVLTGTNGYTGSTAINAGTLQVSSNANLGDAAGGLTFNGGTLATTASFDMFRTVSLAGAGSVDVATGTQLELGGSMSGAGSLTKLGAGTLVLSGFNTHSGGTTVTAGILQAGSADALGSGALTLDGGTFKAGTGFINSFANAIAVNTAGGKIDVNGQVMTLSGTIGDGNGAGGALSFVNSDTDIGAAELGGTNSYSGPTSIGAGVTLIAASDGAFSPNSDVTLAATAALMANGRNVTVRSLSGAGLVVNGNDTQAGSLTIALPSGTASYAGQLIDGEPGDSALALVKAGDGTQILTGTNTYTGGTTISAGTLQLGDGGTSGSITGDVVNNDTLAFNRSDAASLSGAISGSGQLVQLGTGTLTLTGTNTYTGGTTISTGTLQLGDGGTTGSITGTIANNGTLAFNRSDAVSLSGVISGSGSLAQLGTGALTLTGVNTYGGGTVISAGTLIGSAASFGSGTILNNAALVIDQPADAAFANAIDGTGSFTKRGTGRLNLTGTSGLTGPTTVEAGRLAVNGSLAGSAVTVQAGATLGGSGTVGATMILANGTIAPGNSIGTLTVNGNLVLAPGSTYAAEIGGNGGSDLIVVTGSATVAGANVTVGALDPQTSYQNGQRYSLISAGGGVNGSFAGVTTSSAFLTLGLDRRTGEVGLTIAIKGSEPGTPPRSDPGTPPVTPTDPGTPAPTVFQTVAQTRNQFATALALNTLPQVGGTLALYNSLLMLDAASARGAFDLLSGEIHASAKSALVEEGGAVRSTAIDRLRSAFGSVGSAPMATMNYGFTADLAPSVKGPMPVLRSDRFAAWGQGYGSWGRSDADGNAGKLTRSTGGLMIGADMGLFDSLRLGLLAGYSHSEFDAKGRLSFGESDNYHLGLYGGGQFGALGLRLGASYTWHDVETRRTVAFAGFGDNPRAGYDAGTAQVFGELGYRIDLARVAFEPFAGLAYLNLQTDGFREIGGAAALSARGEDTSLGYSALGLRASTSFAMQGMDLTLRGALAWRHAFGDVDPTTTLAFSGSTPFSVAGVPIAQNAALVEAGLDLAISPRALLGLSYTGQLAADAQDQAFKANLAVRF